MDILLSIVQLEQDRYIQLITALNESNLPKPIRWEIIELLEVALEQTKQAKSMGWL